MTTTAGRPAQGWTDADVRRAVLEELERTPGVDAEHIGVSVRGGTVTLAGEPASAAEAAAARKAALRVRGVTAIADELRVRAGRWGRLSDADVAENVANALRLAAAIPEGVVQATVHDGVVTLTGEVPWDHERQAALRLVEHLAGVRAVHDHLGLTPRPSAADASVRIRRALLRNAALDAQSITVTSDGTEVTLGGTVRSFAEKKQAIQAAWASPHVTAVHDHLRISG
jgi:osmotically-inducible protein OsmY